MKASILAFLALSVTCFAQDKITARITDGGGPIKDADVVAILKSGAYQDMKLDAATGEYVCQPTEACIKIFASALGYEGVSQKYKGGSGSVTIALKPSNEKNSVVLRGRSKVPGLDGELGPGIDTTTKKMRMYAWKIALLDNGRPTQPVNFSLNRAVDAQTGTGQKFKVWVTDLTPQVSLVEYSNPK